MGETASFDLFISHRSGEKAALQPLRDALTARGMRLWVDDAEIEPFSPDIARHIERGLAKSRAVLAWATPDWRASRGCQWELTAAAVASEALGDGPAGRLLMVCPQGLGPVPEALRGARHWVDPSDAAAVAEAVIERLKQVDDRPLEAAVRTGQVRHVGGASFDPARFVGRDDKLWEIHGALEGRAAAGVTGRHAHDVAVVHGLGGVGKTMLAREYGARFSAAYPGGIVLLRGGDALSTQLVELLIELGCPVPTAIKSPDHALSERLFIKALRASIRAALEDAKPVVPEDRPPSGRVLWLVDDLPAAPEPTDIDAWRCPCVEGRTLFTTRSGRWIASGAVVSVDALDRGAARALLWTTAGGPPSTDDARFADGEAILDELGDYALGVDVARALLIRLGVVQLREIVTSAPAGFDALAEKLAEDLPTGHVKAISATLRASFAGLNACARDLLRAAAVLAAAPIPRGLLEAALRAAGWTDGVELFSAFEQTTAESLARIETSGHAGSEPSLRLHLVVARAVPLLAMSPDRTALLAQALHDRIADDMRPWTTYPWEHGRIRGLLPHAEHLGTRWQEGTSELALLAADTHRSDGNYRAALALDRGAVEARRRKFGPDDAATLTALHSEASTMSSSGDLDKGRQGLEMVLERRRAVLGPDHPDTLASLALLCWTPHLEGDSARARQLAEEVLARRRRVLGPEDVDTVWSELVVGFQTLFDSGNPITDADHALEVLRRLGERAPPHLVIMAVLLKGMALRMTEQQGAARDLLEREGWPLIRRMQAAEQDGQAWSATDFVLPALAIQGDDEVISRLLPETLERRRRTLGPEHVLTLATLDLLANDRASRDDLPAAQALLEEVLVIRRRKWPDGTMTLLTIEQLASVLTAQGKSGALELREEALEKRRRQLGSEHATTLSTASRLVDTLRTLGNLERARATQAKVLAASQRVHGSEHPRTVSATVDLSEILADLGKPEEARELQNDALGVWIRLHVAGPDLNPAWGDLTNRLRWDLRLARDKDWARPFQEQALVIRRGVLGSDHAATLEALGDLASTLRETGKLEEALQLGTELLETLRRVRGSGHVDTVAAIRELASTLHSLEDFGTELRLREEVVAANRLSAGAADDLDPLNDLLKLAEVHGTLGEADKAQSLREAAVTRWIELDAPEDSWGWSLRTVLRWRTDRAWAHPFQEQVVAVRRKALGADAPQTLDALEDLASTQEELDLLDDANRSLKDLLAGRLRVLGPDHDDTMRARAAIARVDGRRQSTGS